MIFIFMLDVLLDDCKYSCVYLLEINCFYYKLCIFILFVFLYIINVIVYICLL